MKTYLRRAIATLSLMTLLSGCGTSTSTTTSTTEEEQSISTATAIIIENGNAIIVDITDYKKYSVAEGSNLVSTYAEDRTWVLYTTNDDEVIVDIYSVKIITGSNSHEKAEAMAEILVGPEGFVTSYDSFSRSYSNN